MSMADILPAIRRGEVPNYTEKHSARTAGHRADEAGLRGHSVGDTWPYRVVGKGDGSWEVRRNGWPPFVGLSCTEAHNCAKRLAYRRAVQCQA